MRRSKRSSKKRSLKTRSSKRKSSKRKSSKRKSSKTKRHLVGRHRPIDRRCCCDSNRRRRIPESRRQRRTQQFFDSRVTSPWPSTLRGGAALVRKFGADRQWLNAAKSPHSTVHECATPTASVMRVPAMSSYTALRASDHRDTRSSAPVVSTRSTPGHGASGRR